MRLTGDESRALGSLLQVLSTPLDYADSVAWRAAVLEHVPALFGVDRAMFMLPVQDRPIVAREIDDSAQRAFMEYFRHRGEGVGLVGSGISFAHLGEPCAFLVVPDLRLHRDAERGAWALGVMQLVSPVFRAGVALELKSRGARDEVKRLFTESAEAAVLFSATGAEMHRNGAFAAAIAEEPAAEVVCAAAAELARGALARAAAGGAGPQLTELDVRTSRRMYRLNASVLGESLLLREPVAVVWVSAQPLRVPDCREVFGFTVRESEVAQLIAQGRTTRQIAETLGISWHTARRHTERVLAKLNVSTRAAAAGRMHTAV
jgi:DNA-binding CsgD family transcriptional regulator